MNPANRTLWGLAAAIAIGCLSACSGSANAGIPNAVADASDGSPDGSSKKDSGEPNGSPDSSPADTGAADGATDVTFADAGRDAASEASTALVCGTETCPTATECCAVLADASVSLQCLPSCPDAGAAIECDNPAQCPADKNVCCGAIQVTGAGTDCSFGTASSGCKTSCTSTATLSCPSTEIVQLCAHKSDCTDPKYANCCTLTLDGQSETFCLNGTDALAAAELLGATCLP